MLNAVKLLAPLALAGQLFAGGFYLQVGNPEASPEVPEGRRGSNRESRRLS